MRNQHQTLGAITRSRGVSLVETVLAILLVAIIGAIGTQIVEGGFSAYFISKDVAQADWQGRIALERMSRDIMRLRSSAPTDLIITPNTQLTVTDYNGVAVSYALNGTTLTRNGTPLADGVGGLNFSYLRSDGVTTANLPGDVYYIAANFTVAHDTISRAWRITLHPRNLR